MPLAFVLVQTESSETVMEALKDIDAVEEVYTVHTHGTCDVIAKIRTATMEKLGENIVHLRFLDRVLSTLTLIATEEPK